YAILIGAVTSALVIGFTMLKLNEAGTHYTTKTGAADVRLVQPANDPDAPPLPRERAGRPHEDDPAEYRVVHVRRGDFGEAVKPGRYLVDESGKAVYRADVPISREEKVMDNGQEAPKEFTAPQPRLFASIIQGILGGTLEWSLVGIGILIAIVLELAGVSALPVAVGMYLSLASTTPIFIGG